MNNQSAFVAWLVETFKRFALKTPAFFQVFQVLGIIATGVGFLPDLLEYLKITPTEIFSHYLEIGLRVAGIVTWVMAKLPVINSTSVVQQQSTALPFTAQKESKVGSFKDFEINNLNKQ